MSKGRFSVSAVVALGVVAASLGACVVRPAPIDERVVVRPGPPGGWVPGHFGPGGYWHPGHWA